MAVQLGYLPTKRFTNTVHPKSGGFHPKIHPYTWLVSPVSQLEITVTHPKCGLKPVGEYMVKDRVKVGWQSPVRLGVIHPKIRWCSKLLQGKKHP